MKKAKIISILTMAMIVMVALTTVVSATPIGGITVNPTSEGTDNIVGAGNKIIGIIQVVGTLVAVGMLIVLGIKYMMGSAEEKAANKKSMMPYIIGAVLIFAAANIAKFIYTWAITIQ